MSRLSKALTLTLAIAALGLVTTGCGSGNQAQVRVVNAIDNSPTGGLDVWFNGADVSALTGVPFNNVLPAQGSAATYTSVPAGQPTIEVFDHGQTTDPVITSQTITLTAGTQYTLLLDGVSSPDTSVTVIVDTNTAPTSGDIEIRVIDAAASTTPTQGLWVYLIPVGTNALPCNSTPINQDSPLQNGQSLPYDSISWNSVGSGYLLYVTQYNNCNDVYIDGSTVANSSTTGSITTVVLADDVNGQGNPTGQMISTPFTMSDLD